MSNPYLDWLHDDPRDLGAWFVVRLIAMVFGALGALVVLLTASEEMSAWDVFAPLVLFWGLMVVAAVCEVYSFRRARRSGGEDGK